MQIINLHRFIGMAIIITAAVLSLSSAAAAQADGFKQQVELPALCSEVQVPEGNKLSFHTYAIGVQVYRWNGTRWDFVGPVANLFADHNYRGKVGTHYAGPTWESNSGSTVVAARGAGCTPEASAIPWLLLRAVSIGGKGIFRSTTFIQRLNTAGGLEPSLPGAFIGIEQRVPYTAEYYFYRGQD